MIFRLIIPFICIANYCFCQTTSRLDFKNKLSQSTVISMAEDESGFLWLGTADGLNRFDGMDMVTYRHILNDTSSICGNEIMDLEIDSNNNLWIATSQGLSRLNLHTYYFQNFTSESSKLSHNYIKNIEVFENYIIVFTEKGLDFITIENNELHSLKKEISESIKLISKGNNNILFLSDQNKVVEFNPLLKDSNLIFDLDRYKKNVEDVQYFFCHDNLLAFAYSDVLIVYDASQNESYLYRSHQIIQTRNINFWNGFIWFSTSKGLVRFDTDTMIFINHLVEKEHSGVAIETLVTEDNNFLISVGSGVLSLTNEKPLFETVSVDVNSSSSNKIWHILQDKEDFLISTERGVKILNDQGKIEGISKKYSNFPSHLFASNITKDSNNIWISTFDEGIYQINLNQEEVFYFSSRSEESYFSSSNTFRHSFQTDSLIYFSSDDGLYTFNKFSNQFKQILLPNNENQIINHKVSCTIQGKTSTLWIGTQNGLYKKGSNGKIEYFSTQTNPAISHNRIRTLKFLKDSILLVGTSAGLNFYNINQNKNEIISTYSGLANDVIYSIEVDTEGDIWVSTNLGISTINKNFKVVNFNVHDGLQANEFNTNASTNGDDGFLYFGGVNGISKFDPIQVKQSVSPIKPIITQIEIFPHENFEGLMLDYPLEEEYSFKNEHCNFAIRFSNINFDNPENDKFQYRLKGYNHDWVNINNRREVQFMNLQEGKYLFELRGVDRYGLPQPNLSRISIIIDPPYYNSKLFKFLLVFLFLSLLGLLYRLRVRQVQRRNHRLKKIISEQTERLQESNRHKEEFLRQIPEPLVMLDKDNEIILSNQLYNELIDEQNQNTSEGESFIDFLNRELRDGNQKLLTQTIDRFEHNVSFMDKHFQIKFNQITLADKGHRTAIIVRDTTSIKNAEDSIKKSEELFRSYFEKSPIGIIYVKDPSQPIVNCNQKFCNIVRMRKDEILGKTMMQLTHPDDMDKDTASFLGAVSNKNNYLFEPNKRLVCKDGSTAITETHITFNYNDNAEYQNLFVLINDVTEQREYQRRLIDAQTKLIQSEKLASLGQVTAGVAHEINNPVNFIYNGVNNLKMLLGKMSISVADEKIMLENEIQQMLEAIEDGAQRTTDIVKSLRMFTKEDIKDKSNFDIIQGLESTLLLLSNRIKDRITITKYYESESLIINCYPNQLNQVLMNILSNGIESISDKGTISLVVKSVDKETVIEFKDTGSGIPKNLYNKVFEPFFSTKGAKNGTGLGLSISHSIMKRHNGTISISPNKPNGTIITIKLPNAY